MKIRFFLSLVLIVSAIFSVAGCRPQQSPTEESAATSEVAGSESASDSLTETDALGNEEDASRKITVFDGGKWQFRLVTRTVRSRIEVDFSFALSSALSAITGVAVHTANDTMIRPDDEYEIIIGYTEHPTMRSLYDSLSYGEAKAEVIGNKILLAAYDKAGYDMIYDYIVSLFTAGYVGGKLELTVGEIEKVFTVNENISNVPSVGGLEFSSISSCGLDQTLIILKDASEEIFKKYIRKYEGCVCVSESYEAGNCFATFDMGKDLVNVSYSKGDSCLRIIHNKNTEPTELFNKPENIDTVCDPLIIMHGLGWTKSGYTTYQNGLCIIIRLSDGRFIVVDGGFSRDKDGDDLYKLLTDNTPSGCDTVVAAWFITHAHGDHHATFSSSFVRYRSKVKVENVIFNPPLGDIFVTSGTEGNGYSGILSITTAYRAKTVRPHVGDKYYVGDAEIDMLYTVDYQYPEQFTYYNMSSVIFSVKIAGQRIIITGDGANTSFNKMVDMYGDSLKADIVQVAHHGYGTGASANASTGVVQGYRYMSPSLVLWPIGKAGFESVQNAVYNVALKTLPSVKEIIVAEDTDHIIKLPYKAS